MRPPIPTLRFPSSPIRVGCTRRFLPLIPSSSIFSSSIVSTMLEDANRNAAFAAVERHFPKRKKDRVPPIYVGMGTGIAIKYIIQAIENLPPKRLEDVLFVSTARRTELWLREAGFKTAGLDQVQQPRKTPTGEDWQPELNRKERRAETAAHVGKGLINVTFNCAEEFDPNMNMLKSGEGNLPREKLVGMLAADLVVVGDYRRPVKSLSTVFKPGVAIEVIPDAVHHVLRALPVMGGRNATVRNTRGSDQHPWVTDNGHYIIDVQFLEGVKYKDKPLGSTGNGIGPERCVKRLAKDLTALFGVVEHSIFWEGDRKVDWAYVGQKDGTVTLYTDGKNILLRPERSYTPLPGALSRVVKPETLQKLTERSKFVRGKKRV